ncbi:hypothetical protein RKD37_003697 [Streptomyces ambofaciens]
MRATSLTKGYGGNPPSGRSVSPPPTDRPVFLCPPGRPAEWGARNEEFTGAPSRVVAWRRSFEGISQAGRCPNHGCRFSADGTEPSAREALCTSPTVRSQHGRRGGGPVHGPRQCRAALDRPDPYGPPGAARSRPPGAVRSRPPGPASTPSLPDLFRGGTSFRGDQHKAPQARQAHLRSRHQRPAGRPERPEPLRRARGRAPHRRGDGVGGQTAPSRTRVLRPAGPAPARRVPGTARSPRRPHPDRGPRRHRPCRAQPLGPQRAAQRLPPGGQRLPHPRGRPQPPGGGIRRHRRLEGPPAQDQGVLRRPPRRGVPRRAGHHGRLRLDRDVRTHPAGRAGGRALRGGPGLRPRGPPTCPCTRG